MDDFVLSNLQESKNEWCSRLVSLFCPLVIEGVRSIFNESWKICADTNESAKYLMTFQNFLSRVPKWNTVIVEEERKRIIERSGCNYLEDLITCVHIIQLKVLTCIRVGNKQKKIDISIPKLDHFIHKVYIHVARKVYMNVYLFEKNITPLQVQKNHRELELIVQECIMTTIRESIPKEEIIRAYMDESVEHEEEVTIEQLSEPIMVDGKEIEPVTVVEEGVKETNSDEDPDKAPEPLFTVPTVQDLNDEDVTTTTSLTFNNIDRVLDGTNQMHNVEAPKTIERLEEIAVSSAMQRKLEEDEEVQDRIQIHGDQLQMSDLGIMDMDEDQGGSAMRPEEDLLDASFLGIEDL